MNQIVLFFVQIAICLAVSLIVVLFWTRSLRSILHDLCGTKTRADFWLNYTNMLVVLAPVLCGLFFGPSGQSTSIDFSYLKQAFTCALSGIFISVLVIGFQISKFITHQSLMGVKQGRAVSHASETANATGQGADQPADS